MLASDEADAFLQPANVLRQEPRLGQDAIFRVVRGVHLHQRADEVRTASGHLADPGVGLEGDEGRGKITVMEQRILPADVQDVGVLGDDPEWRATLQFGPAKGIIGAQPAEGFVEAALLG